MIRLPWLRRSAGKPTALSKLALSGSLLLNATLLCYYVSTKYTQRGSAVLSDEDHAITSTSSLLDSRVTAGSAQTPKGGPPSKGQVVYDAVLKAAVSPSLLQGLAEADSAQEARLAQRKQALRASDAKLASR